MAVAIKTENLCKQYGELKAVDNLNLEIDKGELFALLGVNGAGKSTTIKMLTCLVEPTSGTAYLDGHSIKTDADKVKQIINVSPQETAIAENLSVFENLMFVAELYGANKTDANTQAEKVLAELKLTEVKNKRAKLLSGGMQRRLSIAMALITSPDILFLDEPTLGLDVLARRELWKLIFELKGKITILLTTHYMEEAESLADRVGIMADGKLIDLDTPQNLISKTNAKDFEDAFVKIVGGATL